ncbi:MAG: hypothetical protein ACRDND_11830 [Streptosporangiaceae bacterium]
MAMQGDVRVGGWARRGRRLLLGLGVLTAAGIAVLFLAAFALASGHGGVLQVALIAVLALMAVAAAAVVALAWIARRLWLRGAWLEALPLLVGLPWLSRVVWAARVLWTGRAVWQLRNRASRRRGRSGFAGPDPSGFGSQDLREFAAQDLTGARSGTTR